MYVRKATLQTLAAGVAYFQLNVYKTLKVRRIPIIKGICDYFDGNHKEELL